MLYYDYDNNHIVGVCINDNDASDEDRNEYERTTRILSDPPSAPEGYFAALKTDLTWDFLPISADPELPPTSEEILSRLEEIL